MKPSTELFELIKSLTKSEKRFFKLSSSLQSGEKNYLKIFDAIDRQNEYDEEEIKEQFKSERFIKHFPSEKNHLYRLILKSLRSYHADNSASSILKQEIKNIEVLFRKALYKECNKFLNRAKKLSMKNEKFYYHIDLIHWEKLLLEEAFEAGKFPRDLNDLIDEEQEVIERLKNLAEYQVLYSKINYLFRIGGFVKGEEERAMVEEIALHPLIKDSSMALSNRARSICYYVRGFCCSAFRDTPGAIKNFQKVVEVMDENDLIKKDLPKRYIRALSNLIHGLVSVKNYKEADHYIAVLRDLKDKSAFGSIDVKLMLFANRLMCDLLYLNRQGRYADAVQRLEDIIEELEVHREKINKEKDILFSYLIAYIYFGNGQYKDALHWINRVLNDNENTLRQDIYTYARIFNLMVHYELGNYDLLEYIIKSTQRYLNKKPRDYKVELQLVDYIKKLSKAHNDEARLKIFEEIKTGFDEVFTDPDDRVILEYIDFKAWTLSKLEDKSFAEMVQLRGKASDKVKS